MRKAVVATAVLAAICLCSSGVEAGPIVNQTFSGSLPTTITGTLPNQNTALEEAFTLASPGSVTITTNSYNTGGFEPNLLLFNSAGNFVAAGSPFGAVNSITGIVGDMRLIANNLAAGTYTLALTDFMLNQSLTATKLSDGFTQNYGDGVTFSDANGNTRTGAFSVTITAAASAVPEPTTIWLSSAAIAAIGLKMKRQSAKRANRDQKGSEA